MLLTGTVLSALIAMNITASAATSLPQTIRGSLDSPVRHSPYAALRAIPFGTGLTTKQLATARSMRGTSSAMITSVLGQEGFALAIVNRDQYPLSTSNGGKSWTVAGPYFTLPAANAGAGAFVIKMLSRLTALAYGNQWMYSTNDGSRHWYVADALGTPIATMFWTSPKYSQPAIVVVLNTASSKSSGASHLRIEYESTDGGKTWSRLAIP